MLSNSCLQSFLLLNPSTSVPSRSPYLPPPFFFCLFILPSLQIQCGGTGGLTSTLLLCIAAGPNCRSLTQTHRAALSLAGHTVLQQTAQQRQRQLQPPQFNTPSHPSASTTSHLKRLQLNHYCKEREGSRSSKGRQEGKKNEAEKDRGCIKESERMSLR